MEWLKAWPVGVWVMSATVSLAGAAVGGDMGGAKGALEMGALAALCYVVIHLITRTLPKVNAEHREERREWNADRKEQAAEFVRAIERCTDKSACPAKEHH